MPFEADAEMLPSVPLIFTKFAASTELIPPKEARTARTEVATTALFIDPLDLPVRFAISDTTV